MKNLVILGAGGYGQTVSDVASQLGYSVIFLDDNHPKAAGKCDTYLDYKDAKIYPAFGNNEGRLKWIEKLLSEGYQVPTLIHPTAYVSPRAVIGVGTVILPKAIVNTDVIVEKGCIINIGALVDHGCILEAGVHLAPGAIVKGENRIVSCSKIDSGEVIALREYPV